MTNDLISRSALLERFACLRDHQRSVNNGTFAGLFGAVIKAIEIAPAVDDVPKGVFEQIKWERDCAMQQLKDHGIPFGGIAPDVVKVVRCCECIYRDGTPGQPNILCYQMHDDDFCSYGKRRADDG